MKKKIVSVAMAASLAVLTAFPVLAGNGVFTSQRPYSAGYNGPNTNYFYTGELSKSSSHRWAFVEDKNTETYYYDEFFNRYNGSHKTSVYWGNIEVAAEVFVGFGQDVTISQLKKASFYTSPNKLRLKIRNGHPDGLQYKTSGTFLAVKGDPNF